MLGISDSMASLAFDSKRKSITLVVTDWEAWNAYAAEVRENVYEAPEYVAAGHAGADFSLSGASFGVEARLSENSLLGLAIGNSWGKVSTFSAFPVEHDSAHVGIYGNYSPCESLTLSWMLAYTRTETDALLAGIPCDWEQEALQADVRVTWAHSNSERLIQS